MVVVTIEQRRKMAAIILGYEARRDASGRLAVYSLPAEDGGGTYEVAGINERYHPMEAQELADLIRSGRHQEAEDKAIAFIKTFTDSVVGWAETASVEFYLRDTAFNRGPRGAARILQRAVGVEDDGVVGKDTRAALRTAEREPSKLLRALREEREGYERNVVGRSETSVFWKGLVNRWNKALAAAETFLEPADAADHNEKASAGGHGLTEVARLAAVSATMPIPLDEAQVMLKLVQDYVPIGNHNRPGTKLTATSITIHNTDNTSKGANAAAHAKYMKGADAQKRQVSWHFTVDDEFVFQSLPTTEIGWHCGKDEGNHTSIGIEICMNSDLNADAAYDRAALLTAWLAYRLKIQVPVGVMQHRDWSGKDCPSVLRADNNKGWIKFIGQVTDFHSRLRPVESPDIDPPADDHHHSSA